MALEVARKDEGYIAFQKKVFADFNAQTRAECDKAAKFFDVDLKDHLAQLEAHHITGNDFRPTPAKTVHFHQDFVQDLMNRYLEDIDHRRAAGEVGKANAATTLRKCIRLGEIEDMIERLQRRSNELHA